MCPHLYLVAGPERLPHPGRPQGTLDSYLSSGPKPPHSSSSCCMPDQGKPRRPGGSQGPLQRIPSKCLKYTLIGRECLTIWQVVHSVYALLSMGSLGERRERRTLEENKSPPVCLSAQEMKCKLLSLWKSAPSGYMQPGAFC